MQQNILPKIFFIKSSAQTSHKHHRKFQALTFVNTHQTHRIQAAPHCRLLPLAAVGLVAGCQKLQKPAQAHAASRVVFPGQPLQLPQAATPKHAARQRTQKLRQSRSTVKILQQLRHTQLQAAPPPILQILGKGQQAAVVRLQQAVI